MVRGREDIKTNFQQDIQLLKIFIFSQKCFYWLRKQFSHGKIKFFEVENAQNFKFLKISWECFKSSAPVELSCFDEKETLKHLISKKKFNF